MCGLMGYLSTTGSAANAVAGIAAGMTCARHRGPDEEGPWHDADVVFGFNRLSIIDIDTSHQPLRWGPPTNPQRYALVFNGEIYNYLELREQLAAECGATFNTRGDGEAIIAAVHHWGHDAVSRLRGMFAFLLWDTETRELFGARDPFGIKPLFYASTDDGYIFSSEAKGLREFTGQATVDRTALQHYLVLQYVPEPATMDPAIRRVESGTSFTRLTPQLRDLVHPLLQPGVHPGAGERIRRAAVHPDRRRAGRLGGQTHAGRRDGRRLSLRRYRLDGHRGVGQAVQPGLITFTTGFERAGYSEVDVAAESAQAIGVRHIVKTVSAQELMDTLPLIVWYLDDPVADPALVPLYFVAREARKHVKVVLSGEGADELFGGYNIYREPTSLAPITRLPDPLRRGLAAVGRALPEGFRGKDLLRRGSLELTDRYYGNARIFREEQLAGLLRTYRSTISFRDVTDPVYAASAGWDPISRMQHVDLFTWLRGDILVKADKMTMANSLELRVPFLDTEVFDVARAVASDLKITKETSKFALRQALRDIVPAHVLHRRKLGFPVPIRHYLAEEAYEWARAIIDDADVDEFLDRRAVLALLEAHRAGEADHSRRIWTILVFLLWHGIFVTGAITPEVPVPHHPVRL